MREYWMNDSLLLLYIWVMVAIRLRWRNEEKVIKDFT
jgi:hypothetical protein